TISDYDSASTGTAISGASIAIPTSRSSTLRTSNWWTHEEVSHRISGPGRSPRVRSSVFTTGADGRVQPRDDGQRRRHAYADAVLVDDSGSDLVRRVRRRRMVGRQACGRRGHPLASPNDATSKLHAGVHVPGRHAGG